jgi:hypothetical protein
MKSGIGKHIYQRAGYLKLGCVDHDLSIGWEWSEINL